MSRNQKYMTCQRHTIHASRRLFILALLLSVASVGAKAAPITDLGSVYTLSNLGLQSSDATTETWRIRLTIDTSGYDFADEFLAAVSVQAWDGGGFVSYNLVGAPGGTGDWIQVMGPANAGSGCTDVNQMTCVLHKDATTGGTIDTFPALGGLAVPGGTFIWDFDVTLAASSLLTGANQSSLQALYLRAGPTQNPVLARLTSRSITLQNGNGTTVPEPGTLSLLGAGLILLATGAVLRRRRVSLSRGAL
jgi:hypothetical protein